MYSGWEAGRLLSRFNRGAQTTNYNTHTYSTPFAVQVNCHFLSLVIRHQSLVPLIVRFVKLFTFCVHSFPLRAHSCTPNHLITSLVAHSYLPDRTITTFYA